jgi:hypothetical protein
MSLTYVVGQTLVFGLKTYTEAGVLADVGTGPTATITLPDGTTAVGSVTKTTTGTYTATAAGSQAGRYVCTWAGSGANSGGLPYVAIAHVRAASGRLIVGLDEARAALDVPATTLVNDDELLGWCYAATTVVEHLVGATLPASKVQTVSGMGRAAIPLHEHPSAITSVTENGTTLAATGYCWDEAAMLWKGSRPGAGAWSSAAPRNVVITYTVGAAVVPDNIIKAAASLVRHWWNQGLQQGYYVAGEPDVATGGTTIAGYAVPNFVVDLLQPSMAGRVPGMA